jgi:hypothetical protein
MSKVGSGQSLGSSRVGPSSSSPSSSSLSLERAAELEKAFAEAQEAYYRGEEDGPYSLPGLFSKAEFVAFDRHREAPWRCSYNPATKTIWLYGDPSEPHERGIESLRAAIEAPLFNMLSSLSPSGSSELDSSNGFERLRSFVTWTGSTTFENKDGTLKQADQSCRAAHAKSSGVGLALEFAYKNESVAETRRETFKWVHSGNAEIGVAIKVSVLLADFLART